MCPGRSRSPYPLPVWAGIAVACVRLGYARIGVAVLIGLCCYLRPSELLSLTPASLLRPNRFALAKWSIILFPEQEAARSKTGVADDSIILDSPYLSWLDPVLEVLKELPSDEPLFGANYVTFVKIFKKAAAAAGVPKTVPYQMRHSGPTIDRALNLRPLDEVGKRGRWQSTKSLNRYEKGGRLNRAYEQLETNVRVHLEVCEAQLEAIVLGRVSCPAEP